MSIIQIPEAAPVESFRLLGFEISKEILRYSQSKTVLRCRSESCMRITRKYGLLDRKTRYTEQRAAENDSLRSLLRSLDCFCILDCRSTRFRMGRAEYNRKLQSREVSPPSENATSDEDEMPAHRPSVPSIWPQIRASQRSSRALESGLPCSVIPEEDLPVPGRHYEEEKPHPEVHIWSAECEGKLLRKHEQFLDEAFSQRGIDQDQALALLFSFEFDLKACRINVQRLRNTNAPLLTEKQRAAFRRLRLKHRKDFSQIHKDPILITCSVKELVKYYYHLKVEKLKGEAQFWLSTHRLDVDRLLRKQSLVVFLKHNPKLKTRAIPVAKSKKTKKQKEIKCCDHCLRVRAELRQVEKVSKMRLCHGCIEYWDRHKRLREVPAEVDEEVFRSPPKRKCLAPPPTLPSPSSDKENEDFDIIHVQSRIRKVEASRITEVITLD